MKYAVLNIIISISYECMNLWCVNTHLQKHETSKNHATGQVQKTGIVNKTRRVHEASDQMEVLSNRSWRLGVAHYLHDHKNDGERRTASPVQQQYCL